MDDMMEVEVRHALGDIRSGFQNRDVVQAAIWGGGNRGRGD